MSRTPFPVPRRAAAFALAAVALLLLSPGVVSAAGLLDTVEIHGFGGWAYGNTDHLSYAVGAPDGKYDNGELALNVSAHPAPRLSVVAQVFFQDNGSSADTSKDATLDYAFAEWFVSDALKIRIGRVKHPFGLYGEIFDVGTLRPFYFLPQSIYGPNGFTAKAYNGMGLTGSHAFHSGWGLQYDLYGGEIDGDFKVPGLLSTDSRFFLDPELSLGFTIKNTVGGRVIVSTPIDGLSFGGSAYTGHEELGLGVGSPETRDTYLGHVEFVNDRWTVRSEWGRLENRTQFIERGGYGELAYKVTDHWQLAARGEKWDLEFPGTNLSKLPSILPQLMEHRDAALGLNYWFSPSFVVRLEVHQVKGNRFAFVDTADAVAEALTTGQLDEHSRLVVFGAQFSF